MNNKEQTVSAQNIATTWLEESLNLSVNDKNNVIVQSKHGLFFLGHEIYPSSGISIDKVMSMKVVKSINQRNASSYRAMFLTDKQAEQLPWLLEISENKN